MKLLTILTIICLTFSWCDKKENIAPVCSELQVLINGEAYKTAPNDPLTINSLEINGDCLTINFSSGGCDGKSWEVALIDAGAIIKTNPPQREIRLSLKNNELCDAWITKELTYDIEPLQVSGGKVYLNIINSDEQILYEY